MTETLPRHIISARDFTREWLEGKFLPLSYEMKQQLQNRSVQKCLDGKSIALAFLEPSTRTVSSFHLAATLLGANVFILPPDSSLKKGESELDTLRTLIAQGYDALVVRSAQAGLVTHFATESQVPIINGGNGPDQHPTQGLLDLLTIHKKFGRLDGLEVVIAGDGRASRTAHSLIDLLSQFKGNQFDFVAPRGFRVGQEILDQLEQENIPYTLTHKLSDVAQRADVVYMIRPQVERRWWFKHLPPNLQSLIWQNLLGGKFVNINDEVMQRIRQDAIIMHAMPRSKVFQELPEQFTNDPRVVMLDQVENGVPSRMAILRWIFDR